MKTERTIDGARFDGTADDCHLGPRAWDERGEVGSNVVCMRVLKLRTDRGTDRWLTETTATGHPETKDARKDH